MNFDKIAALTNRKSVTLLTFERIAFKTKETPHNHNFAVSFTLTLSEFMVITQVMLQIYIMTYCPFGKQAAATDVWCSVNCGLISRCPTEHEKHEEISEVRQLDSCLFQLQPSAPLQHF